MGDLSIQSGLIEKLADFGLSTNEAKVYLSIIQNGTSTATDISAVTNIHREDIYKVLSKLEKKGLIMTKLGRPILISAVPLEDALNSLISTDLLKASEKACSLRAELKQLIQDCKPNRQETEEQAEEQDSSFIIITGNEAVTNKCRKISAVGASIKHDCHFTEELVLRYPEDYWRNAFLIHVQHGVKLQRVLIGTTKERKK